MEGDQNCLVLRIGHRTLLVLTAHANCTYYLWAILYCFSPRRSPNLELQSAPICFLLSLFCLYILVAVHHERNQDRNWRQDPGDKIWSWDLRRTLLTGLFSMVCLKNSCPGVARCTMSLAYQQQPVKMSQTCLEGPEWRHFLNWGSLFSDSSVKLTKQTSRLPSRNSIASHSRTHREEVLVPCSHCPLGLSSSKTKEGE